MLGSSLYAYGVSRRALHCFALIFVGILLFCASMCPWLVDPLGTSRSAWMLPVDIAWPLSPVFLNYGVLCLGGTLCALILAFMHWLRFRLQLHALYGLLCIVCILPTLGFLIQFLCSDLPALSLLTQHKIQALLIQRHFGYSLAPPLIPLRPFMLHMSNLTTRVQILGNQVSFGAFLPCVGLCIVLQLAKKHGIWSCWCQHYRSLTVPCLVLLIFIVRAPIATLYEYEAGRLLSAGMYTRALSLLDAAHFLNPSLSEATQYHVERGQALYSLFPQEELVDSRLYLASMDRQQGDYLGAYQELLPLWQAHPDTRWIVDEMALTIEWLAEYAHPLMGSPPKRLQNDTTALFWLQILRRVDPTNVYALYMAGRIQFDLHNEAACFQFMAAAVHYSSDATIQSSAYTYMALSQAATNDFRMARLLLFKAVELDSGYHNTVAREELSGLR